MQVVGGKLTELCKINCTFNDPMISSEVSKHQDWLEYVICAVDLNDQYALDSEELEFNKKRSRKRNSN